MQEIQERPCGRRMAFPSNRRRETEGGGRGQRRSRRATDGARGGSRLPLRLCGPLFPGHCRPFFQNRLENGKTVSWESQNWTAV